MSLGRQLKASAVINSSDFSESKTSSTALVRAAQYVRPEACRAQRSDLARAPGSRACFSASSALWSERWEARQQPAKDELHVFQCVGFRLPLDFGQSTGNAGASFRQPGAGGIWCRDRQGTGRAHGGKDGTGNVLLFDGTIAPASLDPHVAGAQPVAKLHQHAQFIGPT